ncbi:LacI family DNA-binding transcriptional regulator [Flavobacterium sp. TP390]|uniref:LacI family DNA-binding transcriptional regulator n=1 Tax=Flavobacterium profundi TaxID=1774945 RepID=A0A6I4IFH4_9FLAO|nr:LacI family DNA-binding transcriptional regulator [Flavobacterium profundi]MVO08270.1 LacI family DNA-binding transcriptional regulator [Flavobacterium profundi]
MITLKKISHLTGFSISTVSKALNDKDDINHDTKKIIQDYACKINYKPNKNALALRGCKSYIVAVIVPKINDSIYSDILCELELSATKFGYRIMLFQSFEEINKVTEYLYDVNDGSVDAAIVFSEFDEKIIRYKHAPNKNIPVACIQIQKEESNRVSKNYCLSIFENLLKNIK